MRAVLLEQCVDTGKGTLPNLEESKTPGDDGISSSLAANNIAGEHVDSSLGGTGIKYTCDYYKHNAEKCDKHDNNADGKCCSCKPAGKTIIYLYKEIMSIQLIQYSIKMDGASTIINDISLNFLSVNSFLWTELLEGYNSIKVRLYRSY